MAFSHMTPVQAAAIPLFLTHKDVVAEAVTGSGKTLAFVIPVLEILQRRESILRKHELGAVILCPTRELAEQIAGVVQRFLAVQPETALDEDAGRTTRIGSVQLCVGGTNVTPSEDYRLFREHGPDILVGTPGRMEELLGKSGVRTNELEVMVMDEADRLLDLGFTAAIRTLLQYLPKQRRTALFSATMTEALTELVRVGLRNPVRVVVKVELKQKGALTRQDIRMPATLQSFYHVSRPENKWAQLFRILDHEANDKARKCIVYFATCAQVNYVFALLARQAKVDDRWTSGMQFYSLHGKQTTKRRTATFKAFMHAGTPAEESDVAVVKNARIHVLLCTDVAARGLDLPDVDLVVQYDPPSDPKVFSHRDAKRVMLVGARTYPEYLQIKQLLLKSYAYLSPRPRPEPEAEPALDTDARALEKALASTVRQDRALHELGMRAFVSYIKAYSKHEVNYIFRIDDMPLDRLACEFALLNLPRMPEVKRWREKSTGPSLFDDAMPDLRTFAYADKQREAQRLEALAKKDEDDSPRPTAPKPVKEAWSEKKRRKDIREDRREKKERKRRWLHEQAEKQAEAEAESEDDWDAEERAAKKLKQGKMAQETFDTTFFDSL